MESMRVFKAEELGESAACLSTDTQDRKSEEHPQGPVNGILRSARILQSEQ